MTRLFGIGDGSEDLAAIRALRSEPPGRAADGRRRKTFGAALEQFEQLHAAAAGEGAASAPIPLFYALGQAGRAILAAHAPQPWEVRGHGLSVHIETDEVGQVEIRPDGEGLFQAVGAATGSCALQQSITLAEVRAGIPHLSRSEDLEGKAAALFMLEKEASGGWVVRDEQGSLPRSPDSFEAARQFFPQLAGAEINVRQQGEYSVITVDFAGQAERAAFDASLWLYREANYLRRDDAPSGLMLWWILLQALSSLARYEPARWSAALQPDRSRVAVPLEQTLGRAVATLPGLVLEALRTR